MAIRIQITIVLVIIFQVQGIGPNPLFTILILTLDMILHIITRITLPLYSTYLMAAILKLQIIT